MAPLEAGYKLSFPLRGAVYVVVNAGNGDDASFFRAVLHHLLRRELHGEICPLQVHVQLLVVFYEMRKLLAGQLVNYRRWKLQC